MSWFTRHSAAVAEPPGVTHKSAKHLVRPFGWSHAAGEGWSCKNIENRPELTTPELCYEAIGKIAAAPEASGAFNPGLVTLPDAFPLIVSTRKPRPASLVTGIRTTEDASAFVSLLMKDGYQLTFIEGTDFILFGK